MRLCRFHDSEGIHFGIVDGDSVAMVEGSSLADARTIRPGAASRPLSEVRLLAPLQPGKIIGVGRNYADHAKELGNDVPSDPLLFLKPPTTVIGPGDKVMMPSESQRVDFEGELAIVIGRAGRHIEATSWREHILGFTCANDVTARDLQKKDVQFTRAKGFDTFCPLGPWIETELEPADLSLITRVNGDVRQNGRTSQMIFTVPVLIAYISRIMTLHVGDVILTGTPAGVGSLNNGDIVSVEIEGLGELTHGVE